MTHIEELIVARLTAATAVTNIVGDRVYPGAMPERMTLPAIVYERISGQFSYPFGANPPSGITSRFQFNCYTDAAQPNGYATAAALASAVKRAIEGLPGCDAIADNEMDVFEPEPRRWNRLVDFLITHEEMP